MGGKSTLMRQVCLAALMAQVRRPLGWLQRQAAARLPVVLHPG